MENEINNNSNTLELLVTKLDTLQTEFESKLKYDQHKDKIIDDLHSELQEYKSDLIKKLLQPMIMDVIHAIDDFNKLTRHYTQKEDIDPQKLLKLIASIPKDLEHLLYRQGVESFQCSEPVFNPSRQRVLKTLPTPEPSKDKTIAQSLRQGYEWEGKVLRPEMVEVYVAEEQKK
ncbi:GrpE nucleotide exchange factor [Candidatus Thiomargarita nelsonii]|uniref:GrpE nucleotide exchange factor n=1 Tax=Candidatus Thiomargarita nelsonii TaxID=1003181 RepID=A0A176S5G5_9GAMM|nr:GrpE nucleotide exchange factor [Candidatus Thiomargarita nelsonii]